MKLDDPAILEKYADLIVSAGLNLRAGQRLVIDAPIDARVLVRTVTARAYRAGARLVDVLWSDEQLSLLRFQLAPRDSFEEFPIWSTHMLEEYLKRGDAYLSLHASNPDLLKGQDAELIKIATQTRLKYRRPVIELIPPRTWPTG